MPIYVTVGEGRFTDRVSSIFFPRDFLSLLDLVEAVFGASFPNLRRLFGGEEVEPEALLEEALNLLLLLKEKGGELPPAFFFAVLPKDFEDVASIIGGGASAMTIPVGGEVYELVGGFGRAVLRAPEGERELRAGEVLSIGSVTVKVFTRPPYEAVAGPLKTLAVAAMVALRDRQTLKVRGGAPEQRDRG